MKQKAREGVAIECDITDSKKVHELVEEVIGRFGKIDILVNQTWPSYTHSPSEQIYLCASSGVRQGVEAARLHQGRPAEVSLRRDKRRVRKSSPQELQGIRDRREASIAGGILRYDVIPPDRIPVFEEAFKPEGRIPVVDSPHDIIIFVAGGVPAYTFVMSYFRISHVTKPVRGATLTKSGR